MIGAALLQRRGQEFTSPWWLVACFVALTFGELLVYPLSMALVTRLAPVRDRRRDGTVDGGTRRRSVAGAGEIAAHWAMWSHAAFFTVLAALALCCCRRHCAGHRSIRSALVDHDRAQMSVAPRGMRSSAMLCPQTLRKSACALWWLWRACCRCALLSSFSQCARTTEGDATACSAANFQLPLRQQHRLRLDLNDPAAHADAHLMVLPKTEGRGVAG